MTKNDSQIVPGISVSPSGEATIDPSLTDVLLDLATKLEDTTNFPVDIEHVVAAIVLSVQNGELDPSTSLSSAAPEITPILAIQVKTVFANYGGKVGMDD